MFVKLTHNNIVINEIVIKGGFLDMSNRNKIKVPEAKTAMDKFKNEVASELGVDLKNENLTAKDAGRVGGSMTKKLIEKAEKSM